MKGISVASGNDATVTMSEYISGSEKKFVERMNKVVKDLGLKNTHFVNCTGLDEDDHYSTSYDMAIIARNLIINHIVEYFAFHQFMKTIYVKVLIKILVSKYKQANKFL